MSFMLLILFWISFFMFNFSYLFSVLFLVSFIMIFMLMYFSSMMFVKFLVILVYISGVVVFILYISCMCWFISDKFSKLILLLTLFSLIFFDNGVFMKMSDCGEFLWMFLFFSFLFNSLVMAYSMNLFKISGSLRF